MSLEERVAQLETLVKRQQAMLAKTGEQILKLSVQQQRGDVEDLDRRNGDLRKQAKLDEPEADYFSQDDVVQLVEELQTQLDLVDKRSQLRVANFGVPNGSQLESVPGLSGELYPGFPKTLEAFKALKRPELLAFARFYELLPPDEAEVREMLTEAQIPFSSTEAKEALAKAQAHEQSVSETEIFNTLAKYIGVDARR